MFPVKRVVAIAATLLGFGRVLGGCGYHAVYSDQAPSGTLSVAAATSGVPDAEVVQEVLGGLRAELAHSGVLRAGQAYPRVVVEVVRVDERGSGIAAAGDTPLARGSRVGVVARAWVEDRPGAPGRDTGDVRRTADSASGASASSDTLQVREALRAAARDAGRALAQRLLGQPVGPEEPL
jgi:hypothetical protein